MKNSNKNHFRQRAGGLAIAARTLLLLGGLLACVPAHAGKLAPLSLRARYDAIIKDAAKRNHLDADLLRAIITVESGFRAHLSSSAGARGLMQLMPQTAHRFGVHNLYDPKQNIEAGARYVHHLMLMFGHNVRLALAAYNAGEGSVIRAGYHIPAWGETRTYVPKVMASWQSYKDLH